MLGNNKNKCNNSEQNGNKFAVTTFSQKFGKFEYRKSEYTKFEIFGKM